MNKRFEEIIEALDYYELVNIKNELNSGAGKLKRIVEEKLKKRLKDHEKVCATCSGELNSYSTSNYTLVFGPDDFKKKASFCGMDCLEYFMTKLKYMKRPKKSM